MLIENFKIVAKSKILETPDIAVFPDNTHHEVSILQRDGRDKERLHVSFGQIAKPFEVNVPVVSLQNDHVCFQVDPRLPSPIMEEAERMIALYARITGKAHMRLQIGRNFAPEGHSHAFPVMNVNAGDTGTGLHTDEGSKAVPEGDWMFMQSGIWHYSTALKNPDRITMAVFSAL